MTTQSRSSWCWKLGLTSALTAGTIVACFEDRVLAQSKIVPDQTLGTESSNVVPNFNGLPVEAIDGGAVRGANLFHSFREFNVSEGRGAYFFSPSADIQNILTRVTGNNHSEILGTLGTFSNPGVSSNPNLFLMNPNGIIFGQKASLDVGGSFVATTANAIQLGDAGLFSASEPTTSNLLTINPSALFFNAVNRQAEIVNRSTATRADAVLKTTTGEGSFFNGDPFRSITGLQVLDQQSLLLVGDDVSLNSGILQAPGGRVELGGVAGAGTVGLDLDGNTLQLSFPSGETRADVSMTNGSRVTVTAGGGGDVAINAQNVNISRGSVIAAGIGPGLGSVDSKAGDIKIDATGEVTLSDSSGVVSGVIGSGSSGDISIFGKNVSVINGSLIGAVSLGQPDAGNVTIQADTISITGRNANDGISGITSTAGSVPGFSGNGSGGDIHLQAREISLADGAEVFTTTALFGQGNAGDIHVNVSDSIFMNGSSALGTDTYGPGNAGNIAIQAGNVVSLTGGSKLSTGTSGQGDAGSVTIRADNTVSFDGISSSSRSGIISSVSPVAGFIGNRRAGDIKIDTDSFTISNGGTIYSNVEAGAEGRGGDIDVTASSMSLTNGSQIQSALQNANTVNGLPGGRGETGNVRINVRDTFTASGRDSNNVLPSGIFTNVGIGAEGLGRDIDVTAGGLSLIDGGRLQTSTYGVGNSGNVFIQVKGPISIDEVGSGFTSGIFTDVNLGAMGNSGKITIQAGSLSLTSPVDATASRADINTGTAGKGNAGKISVQVDDSVDLSHGYIFSSVFGGGQGNAGDIYIGARSLTLRNGGEIAASVFREEGGVDGGQGEGGDIKVDASDFVNIAGVNPGGFSSGIFTNTQKGALGSGGDIEISTDTLRIADSAVVTAQTVNPSDGGNITINANTFEAINGGQVLTGTFGSGRARNITLNADDSITISGSNPDFANLFSARGSDVVANQGPDSGLFANTAAGSTGKGGNIFIGSTNLNLTDSAQVSAQSQGAGRAGNITINARQSINSNQGEIIASSAQSGGGKIDITAPDIRLRGDSDIRTNVASGAGSGGNLTLKADSIIAFDDSDILAFARDGQGGDITLDTPAFFGESFQPAPVNTKPDILDGNDQVDVNASGAVAGALTIPDVSFIQNSLTELPDNPVATETLIANSCVARSRQPGGTFIVTGAGGLPVRPGDASVSPYPTGTVRTIPSDESSRLGATQTLQKGDPIVEPTGAYRLASGKLVMSRKCSNP